MMQVDLGVLKKLAKDGQHPQRPELPRHIDIKCANCRRDLVGSPLSWPPNPPILACWATTVGCNGCGQKHHILLLGWPLKPDQPRSGSEECFVYPSPSPEHPSADDLSEVSPRFAKIWGQACEAEHRGMDEISGPGFRKALEVLVKDYLVWREPDGDRERTIQASLSACIKRIGDEAIEQYAERAAWLGNDQVHYEQKHTAHDVGSLKLLIDACISEVSKRVKLARLARDIQHKK